MTTAATDTQLDTRHLTIDYSSGHVLIDGRPIGTFVAEQGPEVIASPAEDLYVVNVPLMVKSVTFLPSGQTFTAIRRFSDAFRSLASAFGGGRTYSEDEVRLALAQATQDGHAIERIMGTLR